MDSSQVFLAKSILQILIHAIDLENMFHGGKTFIWLLSERLPAGLANYAGRLLARRQLMWQIQCRDEETTRSGSVMRIYNLLLQQQEDEIDRFTETQLIRWRLFKQPITP